MPQIMKSVCVGLGVAVLAMTGCNKKSTSADDEAAKVAPQGETGASAEGGAKAGGDKAQVAAPFEVSVHKVEKLDVVAPNKTYLDNGLGKKADAGKTFVCVQYQVKNAGGAKATTAGAEGRMQVKVSALPPASVVDEKGVKTVVSVKAAGMYQPEDWKADLGDVAPGATAKRDDCFEVAADATSGLKLVFEGDMGGSPWTASVDLPAADAPAAAADPAAAAKPAADPAAAK